MSGPFLLLGGSYGAGSQAFRTHKVAQSSSIAFRRRPSTRPVAIRHRSRHRYPIAHNSPPNVSPSNGHRQAPCFHIVLLQPPPGRTVPST